MPTLEAVATALPDHVLEQDTVVEVAQAYLEEHAPHLLRYLPVFHNTGVTRRHLARPLPWYLEAPGWRDRAQAFGSVGTDLAATVVQGLLAQADLPASALDGLVLVTTTGLATPSLEAHVANRLALRPDLVRLPVWGLGCAGGVAGLARTADLARAHPDKRFALVTLELCSLAFLGQGMEAKNVVAAALFGDGCAGALVAGDQLAATGPRLVGEASHQWPATIDVMGWVVEDEGLNVVFDRAIPRIVSERLPPVVHQFLKGQGTELGAVRPVLHPGGAKVLDAYREGLGLSHNDLRHATGVLSDPGNLSSATVLHVLERSLADRPLASGEQALLAAVGPGFAAEMALVQGSP